MPIQADEAEVGRLRVLIVVDTDDVMGATWKLDGDNVKAVLEAGFRKQGLAERVSYEVFLRQHCKRRRRFWMRSKSLPVDPNESLIFYYSGHGGCPPFERSFPGIHAGAPLSQKPSRRDAVTQTKAGGDLDGLLPNYAGGALVGRAPGGVDTGLGFAKSLADEKSRDQRTGRCDGTCDATKKPSDTERASARPFCCPRQSTKSHARRTCKHVHPIKGDGKRKRKAMVGEPIGEVFEGLVMITGKGLLRFQLLKSYPMATCFAISSSKQKAWSMSTVVKEGKLLPRHTRLGR